MLNQSHRFLIILISKAYSVNACCSDCVQLLLSFLPTPMAVNALALVKSPPHTELEPLPKGRGSTASLQMCVIKVVAWLPNITATELDFKVHGFIVPEGNLTCSYQYKNI